MVGSQPTAGGQPLPQDPSRYQIGWWGTGIILFFGITMLVGYHFSNRALTMHEVVFAQAAKEMLQTGDWLLPRVGGVVFPEKPPFTSWTMMAAITICGSDSEWVVRLPSSLATLLTALMIAATAARWFGRRVGILAGLIQLTCYYMLQMATLAESDMLLICSVTASLCFFAWVKIDSPVGRLEGRWTPWVFQFLIGLCFMIKGPVGVIFIAMSCCCYMLLRRQWSLLKFFFHPGGLLVFALMTLPYPLFAGWRYPPIMEEWLVHNYGRFRGELSQMQATEPMLFYFYMLPMVLLPWLPCAFIALMDRQLWKQPIIWWSLCWLIPGMLFLSASAWKWKHYLSPLLPGLTLILAIGLERWLYVFSQSLARYWRPMMATTLVLAGVGVVVLFKLQPLGTAQISILLAIITLGALLLFELSRRNQLRWSVPVLFGLVWVVIVGVFGFIMPIHDNYRGQAEFAERINQRRDLDKPLHLVSLSYDQIIYYLKKPLVRNDKIDQFVAAAREESTTTYLLIKKLDIEKVQHLGAVEQLDFCPAPRRNAGEAEALVLVRIDPVAQAQFVK